MTLRECYEALGEDYDATLGRVMNRESLLKRIVLMFLRDPNYQNMMEGLENEDWKKAENGAHSLKGTALNLGFNRLGNLSHDMTDYLRKEAAGKTGGGIGDDARGKIGELKEQITEEYSRVIEILRKYQSELEE